MSKFGEILNIVFPKGQQIIELKSELAELSAVVEKSAFSDSLEGVVGSQLITLGIDGYKNAYQNNYVIWRGINLLAQSIAALPLQIYKDQDLVPPEKVQAALKGFDINNPNAEMSLYELLYQECVYYWYRGEFIVYIDIEDQISLEPINPQKMRLNSDGSWVWDSKRPIPKEQLIYLPLFNPDSITGRGLSPVEVIKKELLADAKAGDYNTKFWENFGKVGGTLYDEKGQASTDDMKSLVNQFDSAHQGVAKAYKTLGLPTGIKYQELNQTMKEMEFLESRKDIRDRILSILGIHKSVFGVTDKVDRANADIALRQLWMHTLQPNVIRIQNKFNQQLFRRYFPGYRCKFDLSDVEVLQKNKKDILEQAEIYLRLGRTPNEINELLNLGMGEIDDPMGDMRFVPSTLIPVNDLYMGDEENSKIISNTDDKLDNLVKFLDKDEEISKVGRRYVRDFRKLQRSSIRKIAGKMGKYFSKQLGKVLSVIKDEKSVTKTIVDEVVIYKINEVEVLARIMNLLTEEKKVLSIMALPVFQEASLGANELALEAINISATPVISESIVARRIVELGKINNNTYKLIRLEVKNSILKGETIDQLSKRITNVYKFNSARSMRIARTETGILINRSANEVYEKNNIKRKQWIGGTRETHVDNAGKGIVPWGFVYNGGLRFPGDDGPIGELANCTCALAPVVEAG